MVNAVRTHKLRASLVLLVLTALIVLVLLAKIDDDAWVLGIAFVLCVPFMFGLQLFMWALSERGLPEPDREQKPATAKDLIELLQSVNRDDLPFEIMRDGNELTAAWKLADDRWSGLFSREGFQAWYRLELRLDPRRKTVRAIELITKRRLHASYDDASFEYERFRGWTLFRIDKDRFYGFKEVFPPKFGKVSNVDLDTRVFRAPILAEIAAAGWRILPCTYSLRAGI